MQRETRGWTCVTLKGADGLVLEQRIHRLSVTPRGISVLRDSQFLILMRILSSTTAMEDSFQFFASPVAAPLLATAAGAGGTPCGIPTPLPEALPGSQEELKVILGAPRAWRNLQDFA